MTLAGSACPACSRASVPPEPRCVACGAATDARPFEPVGRVLAATRTLRDEPVALVELAMGARLLAIGARDAAVGDEVRLRGVDAAFRYD